METESAVNINTKTHRRLRKAYCSLIRKNGNDKMNVRELTDEADVSRATFYLYYENIEQFRDETWKYITSLFIKQIRMFLTAGKADARQSCKRRNLIFTDDDFELFYCVFSICTVFALDSEVLDYVFNDFSDNILRFFDKKFVRKNTDRFNLFYIGYASVMQNNFFDYHSDKVYRDILRTIEMWNLLFPNYKFNN